MSAPAQLRVIVQEHDIRKVTLQNGIPGNMDDLISFLKENLDLQENVKLMYLDKDFGDQFFSLTTTADLKDKDTVKIIYTEPVVILDLKPVDDSEICSASHSLDLSGTEDTCSSSSRDVLLSSPEFRLEPWPAFFDIPPFSYDVEVVLKAGNSAFLADGTLLRNPRARAHILDKLADAIFSYTAYPSSRQIMAVVEALVQKYPCLRDAGWLQSIKYKMGNHHAKLRKQAIPLPELEVNTLKRKLPGQKAPAKNVKRARKAEVNYLPPYPFGETLENVRESLQSEIKKKNNERMITEKMAKTFSLRRQEVVSLCPRVEDFRERWPALFSEVQIKEEFRRIMTIPLEETFMGKLDWYIPNLARVLRAKGGLTGLKLQPLLETLNHSQNVDRRRDAAIHALIMYLGESEDDLIQYCQEDNRGDWSQHILKIIIVRDGQDSPIDVAIIIEGSEVLAECGNVAKACSLLMGLIYPLNLAYPSKLKYTFQVFQKLFLELDGGKLFPKVQSLRNKLLE